LPAQRGESDRPTASNALSIFGPAEPYLASQRGHDAVSFCSRTSFILAPQDGQSKTMDAPDRRFIFSTTSGFMRAWLKLWRLARIRGRHADALRSWGILCIAYKARAFSSCIADQRFDDSGRGGAIEAFGLVLAHANNQ